MSKHAQGNRLSVDGNDFDLRFTIDGEPVQLHGVMPRESELNVSDATQQKSPDVFWNSEKNQGPNFNT